MNIITRPVPAPRTAGDALGRCAQKLEDVAGEAWMLAQAARAVADAGMDTRTAALAEMAQNLAICADDHAFEATDWTARIRRG